MSTKLLKKHQKSDIRFQEGDFILYEPNKEQYEEIKNMVSDNSIITDDYTVEGQVAFAHIRFIIRELTNIGHEIDEYSDEELQSLLDNGDKQIQALLNGISNLLNDIAEDVFMAYFNHIKSFNAYLKVLNQVDDISKIEKEFNKLSKKNKLGITFEEVMKLESSDEVKIDEMLAKVNKKK